MDKQWLDVFSLPLPVDRMYEHFEWWYFIDLISKKTQNK